MSSMMFRDRGHGSRKAFLARCQAELGRATEPSAMLFVRARDFDEYRSKQGYREADALSTSACDGIESLLRKGDLACRIDEGSFAVFLSRLVSENHALLGASRLQRMFQRELSVAAAIVPLETAIGIVNGHSADESADRMLRDADWASQQALLKRKSVEQFSALETYEEIPRAALKSAILGNRMHVWLQPIWDLRTRRVVGVESLARWTDAQYGLVSPADFVPLAEHHGLIGDFTRWCFNATLRHASALRRQQPEMYVSINFSPRLFAEDDIVEQVTSTLKIWSVPPGALVLEVTEGATMEDPVRSIEVLNRFRDCGIGVALDDFGVGHSSFAYLRQFPVSALKIDRSFVRDLRTSARSQQLVRSMLDLTRNLGVSSIAEGVEDAATLELLESMGCDCVQGFHIAHPQPADRYIESFSGR